MSFPAPNTIYPLQLPDKTLHRGTVFLNAIVGHPRFFAGDYSYASSHIPFSTGDEVVARLAPYLFPFSEEKLTIGKFCQFAHGVQFVTSSANHRYDGCSSFPFMVFEGAFSEKRPSTPAAGPDTVIGHDVWIGTGAMVMPGVTIGDGAIVGAGSVVTRDVPPYTVVAGNPGAVVRERFSKDEAALLQRIAWWDWPIDRILDHEAEICGGDVAALANVADD